MTTDRLSATFAALADPTRRAILDRLTRGPATVGELAAPFAISGPAVSKHLRVLERAGLITQGREAQWRPCSLEASPLREVADYASGFRRFWEAQHDRLDAYLQDLQSTCPGTGTSDEAVPPTASQTYSPHPSDRAAPTRRLRQEPPRDHRHQPDHLHHPEPDRRRRRRVFDAPRTLVFAAHTEPGHLQQWLLGPDGWTMPICEVDLRVGGAWRYGWANPETVGPSR